MGKKRAFFWVKTVFLMHYYKAYIAFILYICKFAITRKNYILVATISNMRLTKICMALFVLAKRLLTFAALPP